MTEVISRETRKNQLIRDAVIEMLPPDNWTEEKAKDFRRRYARVVGKPINAKLESFPFVMFSDRSVLCASEKKELEEAEASAKSASGLGAITSSIETRDKKKKNLDDCLANDFDYVKAWKDITTVRSPEAVFEADGSYQIQMKEERRIVERGNPFYRLQHETFEKLKYIIDPIKPLPRQIEYAADGKTPLHWAQDVHYQKNKPVEVKMRLRFDNKSADIFTGYIQGNDDDPGNDLLGPHRTIFTTEAARALSEYRQEHKAYVTQLDLEIEADKKDYLLYLRSLNGQDVKKPVLKHFVVEKQLRYRGGAIVEDPGVKKSREIVHIFGLMKRWQQLAAYLTKQYKQFLKDRQFLKDKVGVDINISPFEQAIELARKWDAESVQKLSNLRETLSEEDKLSLGVEIGRIVEAKAYAEQRAERERISKAYAEQRAERERLEAAEAEQRAERERLEAAEAEQKARAAKAKAAKAQQLEKQEVAEEAKTTEQETLKTTEREALKYETFEAFYEDQPDVKDEHARLDNKFKSKLEQGKKLTMLIDDQIVRGNESVTYRIDAEQAAKDILGVTVGVLIQKKAEEYVNDEFTIAQKILSKRLLAAYALFEPDKYRMAEEGSIQLDQFETEIRKYKARRKGPVNEQIYKVWNELVENAFYLGKFIEETYKTYPLELSINDVEEEDRGYYQARKDIKKEPLKTLAPDLYDFIKTGGERREQENEYLEKLFNEYNAAWAAEEAEQAAKEAEQAAKEAEAAKRKAAEEESKVAEAPTEARTDLGVPSYYGDKKLIEYQFMINEASGFIGISDENIAIKLAQTKNETLGWNDIWKSVLGESLGAQKERHATLFK